MEVGSLNIKEQFRRRRGWLPVWANIDPGEAPVASQGAHGLSFGLKKSRRNSSAI